MKKLVATTILFWLGAGAVLAEGRDSSLYAHEAAPQVQRGSHTTQVDRNGEERSIGR